MTAAALLRYRFDNQEQLLRHLHVIDGRAVLFFRDPRLALPSGHRVLLEVVLGIADQQSLLRGTVLGRDEGRNEGLWLEFADARLARRAAEGAIAGRHQQRVPVDYLVEVRGPMQLQVCRLIDLSTAGGRLSGLSAQLPAVTVIELRLLSALPGIPATPARAQVLRVEHNEAALHFMRDDPNTRVLVSKLQAAAREAWQQARELSHPAFCCREGGVLEPPLPRIARREG